MKKLNCFSSYLLAMGIFSLFVCGQTSFSQQKIPVQVKTKSFDAHHIVTKSYGKENKLCRVTLEPKPGDDSPDARFIPAGAVEKFIRSQISDGQRKDIRDLITFNTGCASLSGESNGKVSISRLDLCTNKNGPQSVSIGWKYANCN